jgi:sulfur carrier protein ThiS
MQVDVELLVPYRQIAKRDHVRIDMEGDTLADVLTHLIGQIPALRDHLTGEEFPGALPFLLMINGKVVKGGQPAEIRIQPGDRLTITQILAGG